MCYDENDLMQRNEIEHNSQYTGGKIPLPVYMGVFQPWCQAANQWGEDQQEGQYTEQESKQKKKNG